jgi:hypothetical protein
MFTSAMGWNPLRPAMTVTPLQGVLSSAQAKFGTSSMYLNAANATGCRIQQSSIIAPANSGTSGNFTIEMWVYQTNLASTLFVGDNNGIAIGTNPSSGGNGALGTFFIARAGVAYLGSASASVVVLNQWNAIAVVRNSGTLRLYVNGNSVISVANTTNFAQTLSYASLGNDSTLRYPLYGYMDEFRISNIARYTGNYTPATQPFVNDINTQCLIHFDTINIGTTYMVDDNNS